ncbi:MAG: type II toxin-antitoxin system HicB family antitoxin [Gallionella sp.]|nr:type II toxin-antitoxin system HicB family antitoxin [Gallionella sp.]
MAELPRSTYERFNVTMKTYDYAFRFTKEDDGWVITCRDLPEAISQAEANEDRVEVAEGCLQAALESRLRDNEPLPVASKSRRSEVMVSPPAATAAKAACNVKLA